MASFRFRYFVVIMIGFFLSACREEPNQPGASLANSSVDSGIIETPTIGSDLIKWKIHEAQRLSRGVILDIALSPNGETLAVGGGLGIWLYDAEHLMPLSLLESPSTINVVGWSPDGSKLASGDVNGVIRIWGLASQEEIITLDRHDDSAIFSVEWSPNGDRIASTSGGVDSPAVIWNAANGDIEYLLEMEAWAVKDVNWSPDGSMLVLVNTQDSVQVWDSAKWEIMYSYEALDLSLNEISWSPDGVTLAVGGFPAEAFIFSAENREDLNMENNNVVGFAGGEASRLGHIEDLVWSPNSKQMAIIDCLHRFRVWDAAMGKILLVPQNTKICAADWSPDGTRLYTAGEFGLQVWDTRNWELIHDSRGHTSHIFSIAWSPDGKMIASGNGVVQLWDVYSGELARQYEGHTVGIANLVWSPDSLRVASIGMDGLARIWDAITLEDLLVYDGHLTNREDYGSHGRITWSPDGGTLATLMFDPTLQIWNSTNGNLIHLIDDKEKYGSFNSVAWSPKGDYIAVTSNHNQNIYLIESNSGKVIKNLDSHNYLVSSVSWSHDGLQFVSAGRYGFIWLWNAITWKLKAYFDCGQIINSVALSPNGRLLAAACNYEIWVWDVASGELQDILDTHTYIVSSLTWSPDGTKFASGSHDGIVYIWDVQIKR